MRLSTDVIKLDILDTQGIRELLTTLFFLYIFLIYLYILYYLGIFFVWIKFLFSI